MNSESFPEYLKNSSQLYQLSYQELKSLVLQYPYCQNLRLLLMKKSLIDEHADFEKNLQMAATYSLDRTFLFKQLQHDLVFADKEESYNLEEEYLELKDLNSLEETLNREALSNNSSEENLMTKSRNLIFNLEDIPDVGGLSFTPPIIPDPADEEGEDSDFLENLMNRKEDAVGEKPSDETTEIGKETNEIKVSESETDQADIPITPESSEDLAQQLMDLEEEMNYKEEVPDPVQASEEPVSQEPEIGETAENVIDSDISQEVAFESEPNDLDASGPAPEVVEIDIEQGTSEIRTESIEEEIFEENEEERSLEEQKILVIDELSLELPEENKVYEVEEVADASSDDEKSEESPIIEIIKSAPAPEEETSKEEESEYIVEQDLEEISSQEEDKSKEVPLEITNKSAVSFDYEDDIALPEPKTSFSSWLQQFQSPQVNLKLEDLMEASRQAKERRKKLKQKQQNSKKETKASEVARKSIVEDKNIVSETLARILERQEHYDKAIAMYKQLSLKYPEKSSFFAAKIKELKSK